MIFALGAQHFIIRVISELSEEKMIDDLTFPSYTATSVICFCSVEYMLCIELLTLNMSSLMTIIGAVLDAAWMMVQQFQE